MTDADLAVLFDMDGLLVDTEPLWFVVESAVFQRLGASRPWTPQDAGTLVGNALQVSAAAMTALAGSDRPAADVVGWFVEEMAGQLDGGVPWKPGALDLLAQLRDAGVPTALVSSSYRRLVQPVLDQLPAGTFTASVAGDEVTEGKPHPEPYLKALRLLAAAPRRAVVLEDSPTGARAAAAAGCTVVLVPDLAPLPPRHPWVYARSLTEVTLGWLRGLLGGDGGQHVQVGGTASRDDGGQDADEC